MENHKRCPQCLTDKPLTEFHRSKHAKDGHQSYCRDCNAKRVKGWREANYDKFLASHSKYNAKRNGTLRGRARKAYDKSVHKCRQLGLSSNLTFTDVLALFEKRTNCPYCGCSIGMDEGQEKPTAEHIYGFKTVVGGVNHLLNFEVVCHTCNIKKGNKHVYDWYQQSDAFTDQLWRQFVRNFAERLAERPVTEAEIDNVAETLRAEAAELAEYAERERGDAS
ncbi:hypothetical protein [Indiicoccus explosivorum]|uniref:hypothetical protein n=1 Tax=Indiicoccus explosivorum TaxID=1917864 RepID=UPI000B4357E8|nr:hypothetical protein [Indiicoccus explosivorum]